jgi:hypothetical protein
MTLMKEIRYHFSQETLPILLFGNNVNNVYKNL